MLLLVPPEYPVLVMSLALSALRAHNSNAIHAYFTAAAVSTAIRSSSNNTASSTAAASWSPTMSNTRLTLIWTE